MKALFASKWIERPIRWGLAALFVFAGASKLAAPYAFAETISQYGIVFEGAEFVTAVFLSALEIFAGLGLCVRLRGSLATMALLLILFMSVLSYGLWLGLDVECGCFGLGELEGRSFGLQQALSFDAALLAACSFLFWLWRRGSEQPLTLKQIITRLNKRKGKAIR